MRVRVSAPARLHLGDIDPFGLGRFGYAPILAIDQPRAVVEAEDAEELTVQAPHREEVTTYARRILEAFELRGASVKVASTAPRHAGFGSTTQLALSVGRAITAAYRLKPDSVALLKALKRTSTGGVHTFQRGGFALTGGLRLKAGDKSFLEGDRPLAPPLILRAPFPREWRFVLARPKVAALPPHGEDEDRAFRQLHAAKPPEALIHRSYFVTVARLIPAVLEADAESFGKALTELQVLVGRVYFPVQRSIFNPASTWLIPILHRAGAQGVGQSSWGPTVYGFVDSEAKAEKLRMAVEEKAGEKAEVFIVKADNRGARTEVLRA
ncbi:MAG: hypothetical protein QW057_04910 [Candidatus Bathyarchaeia archaeon]